MDKYKFDMHVHTSETSGCGGVAAVDVVRSYHEAGYQGIMISDHYHKVYFDGLKDMDMYQKIEHYLEGYRSAKAEGERLGLDVVLGIEFRNIETDNDFLIVGITEEFLHAFPETYNLPLKQAIDLFHEHGMLVIQAHPVRFRIQNMKDGKPFSGYRNHQMLEMLREKPEIEEISFQEWEEAVKNHTFEKYKFPLKLRVCRLQCEDELDGIEVYNGNYHWAQEPEQILQIMKRHPEYIQTSASDFHEPGHLARGGMVFNCRVKNSFELKKALLENGIIERIQR